MMVVLFAWLFWWTQSGDTCKRGWPLGHWASLNHLENSDPSGWRPSDRFRLPGRETIFVKMKNNIRAAEIESRTVHLLWGSLDWLTGRFRQLWLRLSVIWTVMLSDRFQPKNLCLSPKDNRTALQFGGRAGRHNSSEPHWSRLARRSTPWPRYHRTATIVRRVSHMPLLLIFVFQFRWSKLSFSSSSEVDLQCSDHL